MMLQESLDKANARIISLESELNFLRKQIAQPSPSYLSPSSVLAAAKVTEEELQHIIISGNQINAAVIQLVFIRSAKRLHEALESEKQPRKVGTDLKLSATKKHRRKRRRPLSPKNDDDDYIP
jgi:hypothetical protein